MERGEIYRSRVIMQQTNDNVEACRVASCHLPILPIAITRLKS